MPNFSGVFLGGLLSSFLTFVIAQSVEWAEHPWAFLGLIVQYSTQEQEVQGQGDTYFLDWDEIKY